MDLNRDGDVMLELDGGYLERQRKKEVRAGDRHEGSSHTGRPWATLPAGSVGWRQPGAAGLFVYI